MREMSSPSADVNEHEGGLDASDRCWVVLTGAASNFFSRLTRSPRLAATKQNAVTGQTQSVPVRHRGGAELY